MIQRVYDIYREQQRMVNHPEWAITQEEVECIEEMRLALAVLDEMQPEYKARYLRELELCKSFTPEQIDHICYQIGEWYLMMKPLLEGQHNLGRMKEELKVMICGSYEDGDRFTGHKGLLDEEIP